MSKKFQKILENSTDIRSESYWHQMVTGDKRTGHKKIWFGSSRHYERITDECDRQKNDVFRRFLPFFGVFWGSDPNVMGTIETGSSIRFRKGLYHFCSSNGLVSAAY